MISLPDTDDGILYQLNYGDDLTDDVVVKLTGFHISRLMLLNASHVESYLFSIVENEHQKYLQLLSKAQEAFIREPNIEAVNVPAFGGHGVTREYISQTITRQEADGIGIRGRLVMDWKEYKVSKGYKSNYYPNVSSLSENARIFESIPPPAKIGPLGELNKLVASVTSKAN